MNKQKAKAAFEKYLETLDTFPAYQYDTMLKAQNAYLAGAEWAWGESEYNGQLKAEFLKRFEKLQLENEELKAKVSSRQDFMERFRTRSQELAAENQRLRKMMEILAECADRGVEFMQEAWETPGEETDWMMVDKYHDTITLHEQTITEYRQCLKEIDFDR